MLTGSFADWSATATDAMDVSASTAYKPQSKVWQHDDAWWTVMPTSHGTWIHQLVGSSWQRHLLLTPETAVHADVKSQGNLAHVLLFDGPQSQLATVEYSTELGGYAWWSARPSLAPVILNASVEAATIEVDSTGRLWVASDGATTIEVRYSDAPYGSFSPPVTIATGTSSDDLGTITAFPNGSIGVLWSNQSTKRFGFRRHVDGAPPDQWLTNEVPAAQSALSVNGGMADDHVNVAVTRDGTLYAAIKTSYDKSGYPLIGLLVRRPHGQWENLYHIDDAGTRPLVVVNEARNRLLVVYTASKTGGAIVYRESALDQIAFGPRQVLISGVYNDPTGPKHGFSDELLIMASMNGRAVGVRRVAPMSEANRAPVVDAGADQTVARGEWLTLRGTAVDDGLPLPATLMMQWSVDDGPGDALFADRAALQTTVQFAQPGSYLLRLTAGDGELASSDTIRIRVEDPTIGPTTVALQNGVSGSGSYSGSRDTKIKRDYATTNYGTAPTLEIDGSPDEGTLLYWDTRSLPSGSRVESVAVTLTATNTSEEQYEIYALLREWSEAGATWSQRQANAPWGQTGARSSTDRGTTVLGTLRPSQMGPATFVLNVAGVAVVQQWIDDPTRNFGLLLADYDQTANGAEFHSRESPAATSRPKLTITYQASTGTHPPPTPQVENRPPLVSAGPDRTWTVGQPWELQGAATDDGLPQPTTLTVQWTVDSGPAEVQFTDHQAAVTTALADVPGSYVLRLTATDGQLVSSDTLVIDVVEPALQAEAGLAGHWTWDPTTGPLGSDRSGHGHDAVLKGSPASISGPTGGALALNGTSQSAAVANHVDLCPTQQITLSAWIQPRRLATQYVISKFAKDSVDGYDLSLNKSGTVFVRFNERSADRNYRIDSVTKYPVNNGQWMHIAATYDGQSIRLYINGQLEAEKAASFQIARNSLDLRLGAAHDGSNALQGGLGAVRIYDRALPAAEIARLAQR